MYLVSSNSGQATMVRVTPQLLKFWNYILIFDLNFD